MALAIRGGAQQSRRPVTSSAICADEGCDLRGKSDRFWRRTETAEICQHQGFELHGHHKQRELLKIKQYITFGDLVRVESNL